MGFHHSTKKKTDTRIVSLLSVDFISFDTSLHLTYCSLQRAKIETYMLRRTLIDFPEEKKKRQKKGNINITKERVQYVFSHSR